MPRRQIRQPSWRHNAMAGGPSPQCGDSLPSYGQATCPEGRDAFPMRIKNHRLGSAIRPSRCWHREEARRRRSFTPEFKAEIEK
jgi:hypothetical protein